MEAFLEVVERRARVFPPFSLSFWGGSVMVQVIEHFIPHTHAYIYTRLRQPLTTSHSLHRILIIPRSSGPWLSIVVTGPFRYHKASTDGRTEVNPSIFDEEVPLARVGVSVSIR